MPVIIGKTIVDFNNLDITTYEQGDRIGSLSSSYGSRPLDQIKRIVLHWTGGENNAAGTAKTLETRKVGKKDENGEYEGPAGAHFFVDVDGRIFQFQDLEKKTAHAQGDNFNTIGIEIQNRGKNDPRPAPPGREMYDDTIDGKPYKMLTFAPAQIESVKALCKALCGYFRNIPYIVPLDYSNSANATSTDERKLLKSRFGYGMEPFPISAYGKVTSVVGRKILNDYSGICGHFHVDVDGPIGRKIDPGIDLLESIMKDSSFNEDAAKYAATTIAEIPSPDDAESNAGERLGEMTSNRLGSPTTTIGNYSIIVPDDKTDFKSLDPNASAGVLAKIANSPVKNFQSFLRQVNALKSASTLEMSEAVIVLKVMVQSGGNMVDLNKEVFSAPQLDYLLETNGPKYTATLGDRPLASLESFSLNVQPPAAGGPTSFLLASLSIKVHNPNRLHKNDDQGKHLVNLLKQGYHSRIRFGINYSFDHAASDSDRLRNAFQWKEMDFVTSQYKFSVNNDLSMNFTIELVPSEQRAFQQTMIGENLSINEINEQDLIKDVTDPQQLRFVKKIVASANDNFMPLGKENSVSPQLPETNGEFIRTYASNDVIEGLNLADPVTKTNYINALKAVQSHLLQGNISFMFKSCCYLYYMKGKEQNLKYPAINMGLLFNSLIKPEVDKVVEKTVKSKINIGEVSSLEPFGSNPSNGTSSPKSVLFLYGNFNSNAGQYANKPISTFPVNADTILGHMKEERDVGNFAGTVNSFIQKISSTVAQPENFILNGNDKLEIPNIKYAFYLDPTNRNRWVFYVYDTKQNIVNVSKVLKDSQNKSKSDLIKLCNEQGVPFIELGSEQTFIKGLSGESTSSDYVMANNFYLANSTAFSSRQMDAAKIPEGMSRDFAFGKQAGIAQTVDYNTIVLPLKLSLNTFCVLTPALYDTLYVFFPFKELSGLYTIGSLKHLIKEGSADTNMELFIQENGIKRVI